MLKNRVSTSLIANLGRDAALNQDDVENCMRFIQTIVYNGKKKKRISKRESPYSKSKTGKHLRHCRPIQTLVIKQFSELTIRHINM